MKPGNVYRQFNDFNHFKHKGCKTTSSEDTTITGLLSNRITYIRVCCREVGELRDSAACETVHGAVDARHWACDCCIQTEEETDPDTLRIRHQSDVRLNHQGALMYCHFH